VCARIRGNFRPTYRLVLEHSNLAVQHNGRAHARSDVVDARSVLEKGPVAPLMGVGVLRRQREDRRRGPHRGQLHDADGHDARGALGVDALLAVRRRTVPGVVLVLVYQVVADIVLRGGRGRRWRRQRRGLRRDGLRHVGQVGGSRRGRQAQLRG